MSDYIDNKLENSWLRFAEAYGFNKKPQRFFNMIRLLSEIRDKKDSRTYPHFLLPSYADEIIDLRFSTLKNSKQGITFKDLRDIARDYDIEISLGKWDEIPYFTKESLIEPRKKDVKSTTVITVKRDKDGKAKYIPVPIASQPGMTKKMLYDLQQKYDHEYRDALRLYLESKHDYYNHGEQFCLQRDTIDKNIEKILRIYLYNQFISETESLEIEKNPPIRGRYEDEFFSLLMEKYPTYIKINRKKGPYYPDLVLSIDSDVYIDIEIDEPYEQSEKKEIHYIGCGDENRDEYFTKEDWFVLRFSEKNIVENINVCINIVENLVGFLNGRGLKYLDNFIQLTESISHPQWTLEEAHLMALKNYRYKYKK